MTPFDGSAGVLLVERNVRVDGVPMPGAKRVRLADVAREAGLSVGAASDALSGRNRLPESTRRRVREAAERLGYRPDPMARALRTGSARTIGLLISPIERRSEFDAYRSFWADLIASVTAAAHRDGYTLCILPGVASAESAQIPLSGLILVDNDPSTVERALAIGVPVASTGPADPGLAVGLALDDEQMVALAVGHLAERGCRRPGLLWPTMPLPGADTVTSVFERWCAGSSVEPIIEQFDKRDLGAAVARLLDRDVDGVLTVAAGAAQVVSEIERRGARTLVVSRWIGSDAPLELLGVTSVGFSLEELAEAAVSSLIEVAEGKVAAPVRLQPSYRLTTRASTLGVE